MNVKKVFVAATMLFATLSQAAFVTIDAPGMNAVFSQASFGNNKVEIRIGAVTQLVRPDLLDIGSGAEIDTLFGLHVGSDFDVNFYFIDSIHDSCGVAGPSVIGCGEFPGNDFLVESVYASDVSKPGDGITTVGVQLLSHELGHNLGLDHNSGNFLMNPFINGFATLTAAEVAKILMSPLIHIDDANGQRFILINPVLIVADGAPPADVPEPASLVLAMAGLLAFSLRRTQRGLARKLAH